MPTAFSSLIEELGLRRHRTCLNCSPGSQEVIWKIFPGLSHSEVTRGGILWRPGI
jgi:hypothetical protein